MFERPEWLWLLAAGPVILWPAWQALGRRPRAPGNGERRAFRMLCFATVLVALAGARIPLRGGGRHAKQNLVVALDQSRSIAPEQRYWMTRRVGELRRAMESRESYRSDRLRPGRSSASRGQRSPDLDHDSDNGGFRRHGSVWGAGDGRRIAG